MASTEKFMRSCTDALQKQIPEPVVAVAMLSRAGQTTTDALYFASPLAAALRGREAKAQAGGLPSRVAVGLTATSIYLFDAKPKGFGIKLKGAPVVWDRSAVRVTPSGVGDCDGVTVELLVTGEVVQLENQRLVGLDGFNADFYAHLGATAA
jgi:hypothetical protein